MTVGAKKPAERIRKVSSRTRKKKKQAVPKATRDTPGVREKSVSVLAQGTRRKRMQQKEPNVMITSLKAKYMVQKETNFLPGKKWSNLRTRTSRKVQRNHRYFEKRGRGVKICHSYSMIIHFFYLSRIQFSMELTEPMNSQVLNIFGLHKSRGCLRITKNKYSISFCLTSPP